MKSDILLRALELANEGISVVPVATDGSKRPGLTSWKQYQERRPTTDELMQWFPTAEGVGIICGSISGNLEMLELEGRAVAAKIHIEIREIAINSGLGDVWDKLNSGYLETTPSGGIHWLYRIEGEVPGNTKLARRPGENGGIDVLAETRGEGGFVIVAPTNGTCHPSGGKWELMIGGPKSIPTLTVAERNALHSLFTIFDELPQPTNVIEDVKPRIAGQLTPGDDYNAKVSWEQILEPLGWKKGYRQDEKQTWIRPGKDFGISATTNYGNTDKLYVFSTSTMFEAHHSYSKFAAYATIEHGGDFSSAAKALSKMGYGSRQELTSVSIDHSLHAPSGVQIHDDEGNVIVDSSWIPKEIGEYDLEADIEPTMLRRQDGHHILYPSKINAIFGESESGKTWVALEAVRQELAKGNTVFYIDFEDSARGILNRLKTLKTPLEGFRAFRYANPDMPHTPAVSEALLAELGQFRPSLVVVDGVNAAMNLMGLDLEKNKDATEFSQKILRPLRTFGAGILTIDHVTKSKDNRGNYAIGAQAKRADIDGVAIAVSVALPFGRGLNGSLDLLVTKDRPGFVRAICPDAKTLGVANLTSHPDGSIDIAIAGGTVKVSTREQKMEAVSEMMRRHGYEMGRNQIADLMRQQGLSIANEDLKYILDSLVGNGYLTHRKEGQKYLYGFQNDFFANDVKVWSPNE